MKVSAGGAEDQHTFAVAHRYLKNHGDVSSDKKISKSRAPYQLDDMSPAGSASGFLTIRYSQIWQAANDNFAWMGSPGKKRGHHVDLDRRRPIGAALYADLVHGMLLIQLHKTMALRQTWKSAG